VSVPPAAPRTVPPWVRILDLLAVIALGLATLVVVVGTVSLYLGSLRFSIRAMSCAFAAVAFVAIRHAAFPSDPLHQRLSASVGALRANPPRLAAVLGLASRVGVLVVGYLAVVTIGFPPATEGLELSADPLLNLPARFDAGWYGGIALDGYSFEGRFDKQQNVAFFPAMPGLMRVVGAPAGAAQPTVPRPLRLARVLWGGVVISVVAFAWASNYLVRLAREMIGEARAPAAAALMAAYPFAIFFSAPYTEALFVLAAVGAFYHLRRDEWVQATAWGIVAGLSRPNGCLLTIALVCLVAERRWRAVVLPIDLLKLFKSGLAAAAPALGMLAYSTYVHEVTGSWFGWARLHEAWGRSFQGLAPVSRGLASVSVSRLTADGLLRLTTDAPYDAFNALGVLFVLVMLWPVARRLGPASAVFCLVNLVPPLLAGGLLSTGRLSSTLFPTFVALAAMLPRRAVTPFVTVWALVQGLVAALFFTWRPLF